MTLKTFCRGAAFSMLAMAVPLAVGAAEASPPAATALLFDAKHLDNVGKGAELAYRFQRSVSEPKMLGEPFSDDIEVDVLKEAPNGTREVAVKVFTGERGRPEQRIDGMTGNPLLVVFLDRAVNNMAMLSGGKRPFLKQKMKLGMANGAKVDAVQIDFKGAKVPGHRIRFSPFIGDKDALKMMGYDGAKFQIVVSDKVPGQFVELSSVYESPMKGSPRLEERITLNGVGAIE